MAPPRAVVTSELIVLCAGSVVATLLAGLVVIVPADLIRIDIDLESLGDLVRRLVRVAFLITVACCLFGQLRGP